MLIAVASIIGGLVALVAGGEWLVRGAIAISLKLGLPTLITGLVVVGAATSMPELVASLTAALAGAPDLAWGNIAGSNIANILLILGATALFAPIPLTGLGRRDAIAGLLAVIYLYVLALAGWASVWLGVSFLVLLTAYIFWRYQASRSGRASAVVAAELDIEEGTKPMNIWLASFYLAIGVAGLVIGGNFLVDGAIVIAQRFGVSEAVIGLTIVAIGTSLPELAASMVAAYRGEPGLAVGNVLGSNIYNVFLIGGATMLAAPAPITAELLDVELPLLLASSVLLWFLLAFLSRIGQALGALLLALFVANTAYALMS
jgi:cation:H+ antiporter